MLSLISQSVSGEKYVHAHLLEYFLGHRRKEQTPACTSRSCSWKNSEISKGLDKEHSSLPDPEGKSFFPTSSSFAGSVTVPLMLLQLFAISLQRFQSQLSDIGISATAHLWFTSLKYEKCWNGLCSPSQYLTDIVSLIRLEQKYIYVLPQNETSQMWFRSALLMTTK